MYKLEIKTKSDVLKIQQRFKQHLSGEQILKTTAFAINTTARRTMSFVKKEVKQKYTIDKKYQQRLSTLSRPASGTPGGLYANISFSYKPTPMIGFKHSRNGKRGGVTVEIKKGSPKLLKHYFIATMKSGHTGIWGTGRYVKGKFTPAYEKTSSGKTRITEIKTASPFAMALNDDVKSKVAYYVKDQMPKRLTAMLEQKVKKLTR